MKMERRKLELNQQMMIPYELVWKLRRRILSYLVSLYLEIQRSSIRC